MTVAEKILYMSADEYLAAESKASVRHEFVNGRVFAMSGATRRHNLICGNIFSVLHSFLRGNGCRPYMEAVKVHIVSANCFYYPDVMVACDTFDDNSVYTEEPVLIVEVLSPSTAATDRREKLVNYLQIPTLKEYLIVHQQRKCAVLHRRNAQGSWDSLIFETDEMVLESIPKGKLTIPLDAIYENIGSLKNAGPNMVSEELDDAYSLEEQLADIDW